MLYCERLEGVPGTWQALSKHSLKDSTAMYGTLCMFTLGLPGASVVKNPPAIAGDAGDLGSVPGSGRSPGGGIGNP